MKRGGTAPETHRTNHKRIPGSPGGSQSKAHIVAPPPGAWWLASSGVPEAAHGSRPVAQKITSNWVWMAVPV